MRARNLKPGFFTNEDLVVLEPLARILFAGLWCMADREGRLEDRPVRIKLLVLPADNCDVDALLGLLDEHGLIQRYEMDSNRYIAIPNFLKHQNPHVKEAASTIPAPDKHGANTILARLNPESLYKQYGSKEPVETVDNPRQRAAYIDNLTPEKNVRKRGGKKSEFEPIGAAMVEGGNSGLVG